MQSELEIARSIEPTAIIGVTGKPGLISREIVETLSGIVDRPIVFALSNPTSKSECTARQAYEWSDGKAIFASGSPFPATDFKGKTYVPGQANNAYIFPGVGLGIMAAEASHVVDEMFLAAAQALSATVSDHDLALGRIYPSLRRVRDVSVDIAAAVAEIAYDQGIARRPRPTDLKAFIRSLMYEPEYREFAG
jgi:malate dehydrogenase (oxaloacetate-decarboxylating)(NADP+)